MLAFSNSNTMSLFVIPPSPPPETYESIQYLARPAMMLQILANEPLDNRSPEQAVRGVVYDQWRQYHGRVPLTIQPTFMAAPQSVYYGATITDSGQSVHTLSNLNGHHIITDPETRLPTLVSGHSFTTIFEVPGRGPWYIKAPYPSEERIQAPVTVATTLALNVTTSSDEMEEIAASLFTGTTASSDEPLATPDYPGTPPPTAQMALSPNPMEPPGSATPSTQMDSLPELIDIDSEEWKSELAIHIEAALVDDVQLKQRQGHDLKADVLETNAENERAGSFEKDNGKEVTGGINSKVEREIRKWISGKTETSRRANQETKGTNTDRINTSPASRWKKGEEELEIRAWRAAELYKRRVEHHIFAIDTTPYPVINSSDRDTPERPRKPYIMSAETQQLLGDVLTADRETTRADQIPLCPRGFGSVSAPSDLPRLRDLGAEIPVEACGGGGGKEDEDEAESFGGWEAEVNSLVKSGEKLLDMNRLEVNKSCIVEPQNCSSGMLPSYGTGVAGGSQFPVSAEQSRRGRLSMSALSAAEWFEMGIWRVFDASAMCLTSIICVCAILYILFLTHGRGAVVTREHWSSSPEVDSSGDSDCGLDDVDPYSHALFHDEFSRPLHHLTAVPPAIVAHSDTIMDSLILPVPTAKKPLITFPTERSRSLFGDSDSELTSESSKTHDTDHFLRTLERVTGQKRRAPPLAKDVALGTWNWVMDLADEQDIDRQKQVDWCLVAFQDAYEIIFGALEPHLDPSIMTAQQGYDYHGTTGLTSKRNKNQEGSPPRPDHATTSLDYSLPDTPANGTQHAGSSGDKRKRASCSGSRLLRDVLYAETLKATGYANPETIAQLTEARAALKQGLRCTRQLALDQHFNVLENVPMEWERTYHSLLTDDEVDKLRVLQLACAYEEQHQLAGLIHHLLQVRFRHEYALGHLLGAGFLDLPQGEKESSELWEVLDGSDIDWDVQEHAKGKSAARQSEDQGQYFTGSPWESTIWDASAQGHDNPGDDEHMGIAL
ncbi:hypothetical protein C8J57DRAFT_1255312 [Mycena rebaudengoi]|nr:hypothetical protein C8J57DRAFT_1255312 [Mycena rebaudengoi]